MMAKVAFGLSYTNKELPLRQSAGARFFILTVPDLGSQFTIFNIAYLIYAKLYTNFVAVNK